MRARGTVMTSWGLIRMLPCGFFPGHDFAYIDMGNRKLAAGIGECARHGKRTLVQITGDQHAVAGVGPQAASHG